MGIVVVPTYGSDPATITAANLDAKVAGLATEFNGNIEDANVKAAAGIANSKLNLANITQDVTLAGTNTLSGATTISGALTLSGTVSLGSKILKLAKGADVASVAGAITLGDDGNYFDITGTNAITSITAKTAGTQVVLQFDSTASLVDGSNLKLNGNFQGAAEAQIELVSDGTNWFEVSRNNPSFTATASNALAGSVVQVVNYQTGAVATGTTSIPDDDTIPQNTEGDQYLSVSITPTSATNKLKISVITHSANSAQTVHRAALFQDSTAGALAAGMSKANTTDKITPVVFCHYMTSGTTSSTTFNVRVGYEGAGTTTLNGISSARRLGGVLISSITVEEIKV